MRKAIITRLDKLTRMTGSLVGCLINRPEDYVPSWSKQIDKFNNRDWKNVREVMIVLDEVLQEDS